MHVVAEGNSGGDAHPTNFCGFSCLYLSAGDAGITSVYDTLFRFYLASGEPVPGHQVYKANALPTEPSISPAPEVWSSIVFLVAIPQAFTASYAYSELVLVGCGECTHLSAGGSILTKIVKQYL